MYLLVVLGNLLLIHVEIDVHDASLMLQLLLHLSDQFAQSFLLHRVEVLVRGILLEVIVSIEKRLLRGLRPRESLGRRCDRVVYRVALVVRG